jgi:hypothetical protein
VQSQGTLCGICAGRSVIEESEFLNPVVAVTNVTKRVYLQRLGQ